VSGAFIREPDAEEADLQPDRPISPHPNFVTLSGLAKIDARIHDLEASHELALANPDAADTTLAEIERELRYWRQRRSSARTIAPPASPQIVRFGVQVELSFDDGEKKSFRLVGEDEADPSEGLLSWTSPVGATLIGRRLGEAIEVLGRRATLTAMQA
jgi:transcription elongation GreA/GreB family factor